MEIRPVKIEDADDISRIRRQDGVREEVLALSSERLQVTIDFLKSLSSDDRAFVAVENDELVGMATMLKNKSSRRSHSATLSIMVDRDFQGRGIGSALMGRLLDEADNVLKLHRLELLVLIDNTAAIELYKKCDFRIEATRKHAAVKDGRFVDEYLLGRINKKGVSQ
ncbi:MAG: GNAT family N-acetyltransferase [Synergistaceae bacterium]|nr:GNAT family N-acetyltransferase [Synergistaceae bacterium]